MGDRLNQFYPIPKWIAKFKSRIAGNGNRSPDLNSCPGQFRTPRGDIIYLIGEVRLRGRAVYTIFGAYMDLDIPQFQPKPSSAFKRGRFFDFL